MKSFFEEADEIDRERGQKATAPKPQAPASKPDSPGDMRGKPASYHVTVERDPSGRIRELTFTPIEPH